MFSEVLETAFWPLFSPQCWEVTGEVSWCLGTQLLSVPGLGTASLHDLDPPLQSSQEEEWEEHQSLGTGRIPAIILLMW